jgi:hypothetical protein
MTAAAVIGPVLDSLEGCGQILVSGDDEAVAAGRTHAEAVVAEHRVTGRRIPGAGYPIHRYGDPHARRLAGECGLSRRHLDKTALPNGREAGLE